MSVWFEWPPFRIELPTRLAMCSDGAFFNVFKIELWFFVARVAFHCLLVACNEFTQELKHY